MLRFNPCLSLACILIGISVFFVACKNKTSSSTAKVKAVQADELEDSVKVQTIFYNVPSPVEVTGIIQKMNLPYYPDLLNPTSNADNYLTQANKALNIGVYGADLSYTRIHNQYQDAANFLKVIHRFSNDLGIPESSERVLIRRLEKSLQDKDSLLKITVETFTNSDSYLKESQRESIAALIVLGGWIEVLYIATNILERDSSNNKMVKLIAEQRYSVKSMLALMLQFSDEKRVKELIPYLKKLNDKFQEIGEERKYKSKLVSKYGQALIENKIKLKIPSNLLIEVKALNDEIRAHIVKK